MKEIGTCGSPAGFLIAGKESGNEECPDTFRHPGYYEKIYLCV